MFLNICEDITSLDNRNLQFWMSQDLFLTGILPYMSAIFRNVTKIRNEAHDVGM